MFGSIMSWIICGFVVGMLARWIVPGSQSMGWISTTVLGISGALLGGFLYSSIWGTAGEPFSVVSHNWYGWIVALAGAILLVWAYPFAASRQWRN